MEVKSDWKTQQRGGNKSEYQIYLVFANDGRGNDATTGEKLRTFDEWLNS